MTQKKSIAIIGSGITGLSAAWLLHEKYDVTLFEKNDYLGGHTHTHDLSEGENPIAIDSGFIVYNEKNYPNLVGLFKQLDVTTQATDMSFALSLNEGELEYSGTGLIGMFAQRSNIFKPKHWLLLKEIIRFNKLAHSELEQLEANRLNNLSLGEFLKQHHFSKDLQQHYLLPMGAAIWSCPAETMNSFPAFSFLQFFANHGLIDLKDRPQWRSVVGGSREYIRKMMPTLETQITIKAGVDKVKRESTKESTKETIKETIKENSGITITSGNESLQFDQVIFACHADQALTLLEDASMTEVDILKHFNYQENITYLHTDENLMPKRKKAWSCWNYLAQTKQNNKTEDLDNNDQVTVTYWMNSLQKLQAEKNYLVTLNPYSEIDPEKTIKKMTYHHPVFTADAISAQSRLNELQGQQNSWFCGSYAGYGFHEDALSSSVRVCEQLGVDIPWKHDKSQSDV